MKEENCESRQANRNFKIMKALIFYQDFASAVKANAALQSLKLSTDTKVQWEVVPWRLDMLIFPPTRTEALVAAGDAHLMLFVGGLPQSLPFWLLDWLENWATARQVKDAALAVTAGTNEETPTLAAISELRQFATQHGLSFIMDSNIVRESWIDPLSIGTPSTEPYHRWGINE
jgi:hypothetical protein